jgi:hypothetical protein
MSGISIFILRSFGRGSNGKVAALGEILLTLLLAELDVQLVAVTSQFLGLEGIPGPEVLSAVLRDFIHGQGG